MRLSRYLSVGGLVLLMTAVLVTPYGWAQEKPAAAPAPQASPAAIQVPQGTTDGITAIMTRRSIRDYTQHPVPDELIHILVQAGMVAPSAFNERYPGVLVINDRKILDAIYKLNTKSLQIKKATVAIVICGNQEHEKNKGQGMWQARRLLRGGEYPHRGQRRRPGQWCGRRFILSRKRWRR